MKLSTTTNSIFKCFGFEEGIALAKETGFDALDLNLIEVMDEDGFSEDNFEKTAVMLKQIAQRNAICFNQSHAPFPSVIFGNEGYNKRVKANIIRAIKIAGIVGADQIVIHPTDCRNSDRNQDEFNLEFYDSLTKYCKEYNIKIAVENMWGLDDDKNIVPNVCSFGKDLADFYDKLDKNFFTVCLDTGHFGLLGESCSHAARELGGERLGALHVHDNDGIGDDHTIPFQGEINWNDFMKTLAEIGYKGDLTYEVGGRFLSPYIQKPTLFKAALNLLAVTGKELINIFEAESNR